MTNLKTCPFCGGKAEFGWFGIVANVNCIDCGVQKSAYPDEPFGKPEQAVAKKTVIAAWNARADVVQAMVDEAELRGAELAKDEAQSIADDIRRSERERCAKWVAGYFSFDAAATMLEGLDEGTP